ncbi:autotransporter outer membrane beta-barrel domain-containing protein [Campylobacter porcelli]|uniref:Autotransporter domain protein n=2 Tax=Campylobacteraceae TaxID=72294 RepID=A0A1X9SYS9_9BACT|nr:autotransporter outer membrane beta-barrel domain-containing protein [Campylobacter sp. RM6137]ARR01371.1 autotransporter domain protein [Campylobacter sp. RM6137]
MMADEMDDFLNSFYFNTLAGDFKDGTNPRLYGGIFGYDRFVDDLLIGTYFSYANSKSYNVELKSNIYELGFYTRYFMDSNEFDFNLAGGYGNLEQNLDRYFNSKFDIGYMSFGLGYGYRVSLNEKTSIKPYIGADYLYFKSEDYILKDKNSYETQKVQSNTAKNLKAKIGLETIQEFNDFSLYTDLKIKRDLIVDDGVIRSSFTSSNAGFIIDSKDKKHTNFAIDTGVLYIVNKNLSINLNLGADINSDDKLYSANFGLSYRFN